MSDQPPSGQPPPSYQPPPPSNPNSLIPPSGQRRNNIWSSINPRILVAGAGIVIVVLLLLTFLPRGGVDPQLAALQTQNALLAQSVTSQAANSQVVVSQPTQAPIVIPSPTEIIVATPQPPQVITATPIPQVFQAQTFTQTLQSTSQDGTVFNCPVTGQYTLVITSGVYSPFANGTGGKWRTFFTVYHNEPVVFRKNEYGFTAPAPGANETIGIGNMELAGQSKEQAEVTGRGGTVVTTCKQGEYLRFVAADEKASYKDNFGTVTIEISVTA